VMAYRVLEVTLISAKDLKKVTLFSKMRVYAVVSISGGDPRTPTHRTHSDRHGGRNPMWHAPLRFPIPTAADPRGLALHVLLRAERSFGDRDVGEVVVPVQDLVAVAPPAGEHRHLSYQVRSPMSGRKRGVLHISYSLSDAPAPTAAAPGDGHTPCRPTATTPRTGTRGRRTATAPPRPLPTGTARRPPRRPGKTEASGWAPGSGWGSSARRSAG
uniref:C2 domain-containing protein n=1 Tax=Aegilops tauschii subsp. strangulata TaxID=200361 RepID=A0A452Y001_AEGTS